jgi:beta-mannosidase
MGEAPMPRKKAMLKQHLHDNWTVRAVGDLSEVPDSIRGESFPAKVPGCVHTDLMRAGRIPDPYRDFNEFEVRWIGRTDWEYRTTFDADAKLFEHERIDLVCDGLDTVAKIELNGVQVAQTFNMHRGYRFDVKSTLKPGKNELVITFNSPVEYAEAMRTQIGPRPYVNGPAGPFNFIRKMACNFGWDWGPALPTSGIWRGIRLEAWSYGRITRVQPRLKINADRRVALDVAVSYEINKDTAFQIRPMLKDPQGQVVRQRGLSHIDEWVTSYELSDAQLWWPKGRGAQPLYEVGAELTSKYQEFDDPPFDAWSGRIGLRTVELDASPDDIGRKFVVKVNGKPIFCKGFNWIPDDCFLDRACEPGRVRERIQQAVDAGGNMLRVWGGGIFETDDFYNICDELGVLVWQDFLFACAMYPEEQPFWSEVEEEAKYNVARLAHHPSLAIWNGCNENIWAYRDWGWKDHEDVKGRTWGKDFYFELLPKICKELTPGIPYWAGSPWSGDYDVDNGVPPNAATHGNKHVWEAWFKEDYAVYRKFAPRFCSEFGFQGPANFATIASVVPVTRDANPRSFGPPLNSPSDASPNVLSIPPRDFGSPEMRHRQKSGNAVQDDGDRRNLRHLIRHFNCPGAEDLLGALDPVDPKATPPACGAGPLQPARRPSRANFDDLHYLLQLNQCRALTLGVEWFRSRQPVCMGTLYWQLNDCWPGVTSWSCIDGDGRKKPLWYATRKFFAPQLLTIQPEEDGSLWLHLINDTDEPSAGAFLVARRAFDGTTLAEQEVKLESAPRSTTKTLLKRTIAQPDDPADELISVGVPAKAAWFFDFDRNLRYPKPDFDAQLTRDGNEHRLTIRAKTLLRDLVLNVDRLDPGATVSEQLITLLPRDAFTFVLQSKADLRLEQLMRVPVLQCANRFGGGA